MQRQGSQRGMTLVEIMVAGALLSVVLSASMGLLIGVSQSTNRVMYVGDTQEAGRLALEAIAADIRIAGMGAQLGSVGVAPAAGSIRRIPIIYSGPDINVVETNSSGATETVTTNSIFIISGQPATGVLAADGSGMTGTVVGASIGSPLSITCSNGSGTNVDCSDVTFKDFALLQGSGTSFSPLIVGDLRSAVYLTPTSLAPPVGTPPSQVMNYAERSANAYSPDPRAPFGFAPGAAIHRARVLHYYLWPTRNTNYYELRRSFPVLAASAGNLACDGTDAPFIDETNGPTGSVIGSVIGSGPLSSLQIRYVADPTASDDPSAFQMMPVTVCSTALVPYLREIRLQVVARAVNPDKTEGTGSRVNRYSTPGFEGMTPVGGATYFDAYPRRTFNVDVVPRNLQGVRL